MISERTMKTANINALHRASLNSRKERLSNGRSFYMSGFVCPIFYSDST